MMYDWDWRVRREMKSFREEQFEHDNFLSFTNRKFSHGNWTRTGRKWKCLAYSRFTYPKNSGAVLFTSRSMSSFCLEYCLVRVCIFVLCFSLTYRNGRRTKSSKQSYTSTNTNESITGSSNESVNDTIRRLFFRNLFLLFVVLEWIEQMRWFFSLDFI